MIKSMTGYGSAKGTANGLELTVEIKSVNSRYSDISVRLPRSFVFAEETVKKIVQNYISRGKTDVFITVNDIAAENYNVRINEALAENYIKALKNISEKFGVIDAVSNVDVGRFQDILVPEKPEIDRKKVSDGICSVLTEALREFNGMRAEEGSRLCEDMAGKLDAIERLLAYIENRSPATVLEYRARLEQKIREVLENADVDEARLITEVAIFADKVSVDEEIVRLKSHISQMRHIIREESPAGRKLDFLVQEINREINTIGSKCVNADISKTVVDMKSEAEKLREQIQNAE